LDLFLKTNALVCRLGKNDQFWKLPLTLTLAFELNT